MVSFFFIHSGCWESLYVSKKKFFWKNSRPFFYIHLIVCVCMVYKRKKKNSIKWINPKKKIVGTDLIWIVVVWKFFFLDLDDRNLHSTIVDLYIYLASKCTEWNLSDGKYVNKQMWKTWIKIARTHTHRYKCPEMYLPLSILQNSIINFFFHNSS